MHFHKIKGKQILDLRGDFILSKRADLITTRVPSAAPHRVRRARYVLGIAKLGFFGKIRATLAAVKFIWTK